MLSIPDKKYWIVPQKIKDEVVLPPKYKGPPERSKKERYKKSSEKLSSSSNYYGRSDYKDHNRCICDLFP